MTAADRAFNLVLKAYPRAFRADYAVEMAILFRDRRRTDGVTGIRLWTELLWDVARSAPALRLEALRRAWEYDTRTREESMVPLGILAVLAGALEVVNVTQVVWLYGTLSDGYELAADTAGTAAGILLIVAGIGLLRRSPRATTFAQVAAIACLVVFTVTGVLRPVMSLLATGVGTLFPIAMLIVLYRARPRQGAGPVIG